jgi:hypothetical protein
VAFARRGLAGQFAACSVFLLVLRLPPVKRWIAGKRALDQRRTVWLAVAPLIRLFCFAFAFIVHEELFKRADMFRLHPSPE